MKYLFFASAILFTPMENVWAGKEDLDPSENLAQTFTSVSLKEEEKPDTKRSVLNLNPSQRPNPLKELIRESFEFISKRDTSNSDIWTYNGDQKYKLMLTDDHKLVKTIIKEAPVDQKEFYILDIGAGDFRKLLPDGTKNYHSYWGKALADFINQQTDLPHDIKVHIISLTGENYTSYTQYVNRCRLYNLAAFEIENLTESLTERLKALPLEDTLENMIDCVVSRYCFIHLHDAIGTFAKVRSLLRPNTGIALIDGFPVIYAGEDSNYDFRKNALRFLRNTGDSFVLNNHIDRDEGTLKGIHQFLLKRSNNNSVPFPLEYAGIETKRVNPDAVEGIAKVKALSPDLPAKSLKSQGFFYGDPGLIDWLSRIKNN